MRTPAADDFHDFFRSYQNVLNKPRGLLSVPLAEDEEWKTLENDRAFIWIEKMPGFNEAILTLSYKKLIESNPISAHDKLKLAYICSTAFYIYLTKLQYPGLIKVTNKSLLKRANSPVKKLLELLDDGLQMQNSMDTQKLKNLLTDLHDEITDKAPTSYPTENKGYLADKDLVVNLYDSMYHYYNDAPTTAIHHILSIIDRNISKRQVERYVSAHRDFLEKRKEYEEIKEERAGLFGVAISSRQE